MSKQILNIVETAYRAVMEEQDDTVFWALAAMQGAGANHTVVLRGNAVNYTVANQGVDAHRVGSWSQSTPPRMDRDLVDLMEKRKIPVFVVAEDLADRGITPAEMVPGVTLIARKAMVALLGKHSVVHHW
jgi:sulfur transfer complex TusBCD TusB component (DsrH family)